jgi:hypothetical protein
MDNTEADLFMNNHCELGKWCHAQTENGFARSYLFHCSVDGSNRIVVFQQMVGRESRKLRKRMEQHVLNYVSTNVKGFRR